MRAFKILLPVGLAMMLTFGGPITRSDSMADRQAAPAEVKPPTATPTAATESPPSSALMLLDDQSRRIGFQALLTNEDGNPINMPNGQHELDFRIYDSDAGGVPIGAVLDVLVTLDGGVASTLVGPLNPSWFDGTARWMGVTVDNGDELTPLIPIGSVPYAFRVDRVASEELDDDIMLGDSDTAGSLTVHSGGLGRIALHGQGQLMETRDDSGALVALYGYDAFGGGASCLLGTSVGTTGLLLDGNQTGVGGGHIVLYNNAAVDAISLLASSATLRVGSLNSGGPAGNIHLYPSSGVASRIHLNGQDSDLRLGLTGTSSGDLRAYSASGGIETIHLNGGGGQLSLTDGIRETVRLDGSAASGGGGMTLWNSAGTQTVEIDGDEVDHGVLRLWDGAGTNTVEIEAREAGGTTGGQMVLRDSSGAATIVLDAEAGVGGPGQITASGAVGIGTTSPNHELVVQGDDPAVQIRDDTTDNSANAARLELLENAAGSFDGGAYFWWNGETNKLLIGTKLSGANTNVLVVDRATNSVGIGTQTPGDYRLAVNGPIRAKEIVVETGWSDFVFEPDYDLPSLESIEDHIRTHGRLPDIPSAEEVATHGVKVGEMEAKLLQKIEELTLHVIDMNKRVESLEQENARLRQGVAIPDSASRESQE